MGNSSQKATIRNSPINPSPKTPSKKRSPPAPLNIKTITGKTFKINISLTQTVKELKDIIATQEDISFKRNKLVFGQETLEDHKRLIDYAILPGSLIMLTLDLKSQKQVRPVSLTCADHIKRERIIC